MSAKAGEVQFITSHMRLGFISYPSFYANWPYLTLFLLPKSFFTGDAISCASLMSDSARAM